MFQEGHDCVGMIPVVDGYFLTDYPSAIRESGKYSRVPEMVGITEDEGSGYLLECELSYLHKS